MPTPTPTPVANAAVIPAVFGTLGGVALLFLGGCAIFRYRNAKKKRAVPAPPAAAEPAKEHLPVPEDKEGPHHTRSFSYWTKEVVCCTAVSAVVEPLHLLPRCVHVTCVGIQEAELMRQLVMRTGAADGTATAKLKGLPTTPDGFEDLRRLLKEREGVCSVLMFLHSSLTLDSGRATLCARVRRCPSRRR